MKRAKPRCNACGAFTSYAERLELALLGVPISNTGYRWCKGCSAVLLDLLRERGFLKHHPSEQPVEVAK